LIVEIVLFVPVKYASLLFCEELNGAGPDEISAKEISQGRQADTHGHALDELS